MQQGIVVVLLLVLVNGIFGTDGSHK